MLRCGVRFGSALLSEASIISGTITGTIRTAVKVLSVTALLVMLIPAVGNATMENLLESISVPEVHEVDGHGNARASIPIILPPARGGLKPEITIDYDSFVGSGLLGAGWSIGGLSHIERNTGHTGSGDIYSATDFVSSIAGELVARTDWCGDCYGAAMEKDFTRYDYDDTDDFWVATTKDGTTYTYGASSTHTEGPGSNIFRWNLESVVDLNGNTITITGSIDGTDNKYYVSQISYEPSISVNFTYETNSGRKQYSYLSDEKAYYSKRLDKVTINHSTTEVREYDFTYSTGASSQVSVLTSYVQSGEAGTNSYPAVSITYSDFTPDSTSATSYNPPPHASDDLMGARIYSKPYVFNQVGDFNGDGKQDIITVPDVDKDGYLIASVTAFYVSLSGVDTFEQTTKWSNDNEANTNRWAGFNLVGDFDGDGKDDMAVVSGGGWRVLTSTGSTFNTASTWSTINADAHGKNYVMDANGDGKDDILVLEPAGNGYRLLESDGTAFATTYDWSTYSIPGEDLYGFNVWAGYTIPADLNGDGYDDVAFLAGPDPGPGVTKYFYAYITSVDAAGVPSPGLPVAWHVDQTADGKDPSYWGTVPPRPSANKFIDVNGDGMDDLVYMVEVDTDECEWYVALSTRDGAVSATSWTDGLAADCTADNVFLADVTGELDGMADLIIADADAGTFNVYSSDGNSAFSYRNDWHTFGSAGTNATYAVGDFSGDGRSDFLYWDITSGNKGKIRGAALNPEVPDLLETMTSPLGGKVTIDYASTIDSGHINYDGTTFMPYISQVVTYIAEYDGSDTYVSTYHYTGGKYDHASQEFWGFNRLERSLPDGNGEDAYYSQTSNYRGLLNSFTKRDNFPIGSGNRIDRHDSVYNNVTQASGTVVFPYVKYTARFEYDGSSPAGYRRSDTNYAYDSYGNVTEFKENGEYAVNYDERYKYIYYVTPDTTDWVIDRVSNEVDQYRFGYGGSASWTKYGESTYAYDVSGNLSTYTKWVSDSPAKSVTYTYSNYDSYGNPGLVTDPNSNTTSYTYSDGTYIASVIEAGSYTTTYVYDAKHGNMEMMTGNASQVTTYQYDDFGRMTTYINPVDNPTYPTVTYTYNDGSMSTPNSLKVTTDTRIGIGTGNVAWEKEYLDGLGRLTKTEKEGFGADTITVDREYDDGGRLYRESMPYISSATAWTSYLYDAIGRVTTVNKPGGGSVTTSYFRGSNTITDENGNDKDEERDTFGYLLETTEYAGTYSYVTSYTYGADGTVLRMIDDDSNGTTYQYDGLGRLLSVTDANFGAMLYAYDGTGNMLYSRAGKGDLITYTYDGLNRVTKKDYPSGTDTDYTYDEVGHGWSMGGKPTTVADSAGTTSYSYNAAGYVASKSVAMGTTTYTTVTVYRSNGEPLSIIYPDDEQVLYSYDDAGFVNSISRDSSTYVTYSSYDAMGRPLYATYGNGVTTSYAYDSDTYRLSSSITTTYSTIFNPQYTYDTKGNVKTIDDLANSDRLETFTYDDLDRLTKTLCGDKDGGGYDCYGTYNYEYDGIGNITRKGSVYYTYASSMPHAPTSSTNRSFTYNVNGSMLTDSSHTITYDYDHRIYQVSESGSASYTYTYNADGEIAKVSSGGTDTYYVGDIMRCVGVGIGDNCLSIVFNGDERVGHYDPSIPMTYFYHLDRSGSTRIITEDSKVVSRKLRYMPLGEEWEDSNSSFAPKYMFGSREYNRTVRIYHGQREYSPLIGRFVTPERDMPQDYTNPQSFNRYSYVLENPYCYAYSARYGGSAKYHPICDGREESP